MGYQESYVTIKGNVDDLITLIQKLGKDHFEERSISPVEIIILQQDITGDLTMMCRPERKYNFKKSDKFIYVVGERSGQRSVYNMFGENGLENTEIYFTECFPSDKIFTEDGFAVHEEFLWK